MRTRIAILCLAGVAAAALTACGGDGAAPAMSIGGVTTGPAAQAPAAQAVDTAQALAQARHSSETASPYSVDGGALMLTDTADTTEALDINGT